MADSKTRNEAYDAGDKTALDWKDTDEAELEVAVAVAWTGAPFASTQGLARARRVLALLREENLLATDRAFE